MPTKKRTTQASRLAARNTKRFNTRLIAVGIFAVVLIAIIWAVSSSAQKPPAANTAANTLACPPWLAPRSILLRRPC